MVEGQDQAEGKTSAQTKTDQCHPNVRRLKWPHHQTEKSKCLSSKAEGQKRAPVATALRQSRHHQRGQHLKHGHECQQRTALGRAPVHLQVIRRQPGNHAHVTAINQPEVQRQQPGPAVAPRLSRRAVSARSQPGKGQQPPHQ